MIKINVIAVGRLKEEYFTNAQKEYLKRLTAFANVNVIEVPEGHKDEDILGESKRLLEKMKGYSILLDIEGELLSSEELARHINKKTTNGESTLNFIIGGSRGVSKELKDRVDFMLSFGRITYPHQLLRVVLLEQIYRAFTILNNTNYHK